MVSANGSVQWHPVWVIASEDFMDDLNVGGPIPTSSTQATPTPLPGWTRTVNMYDTKTGKLVLGYLF